ncbi:MAG: cupin domain-containing protein [Burkholderiales bacterium]|nr:cupin domain-containing protein [Opitutaceae bacterium]
MKLVHIPDLPELHAKSPTGKYQSSVKDISLALGGVKDTGAWGGGHPFDLQQRRVPPGASVCPLHAHTAQWELFVVLAGTASVRTGDGKKQSVRAGDAFVQPPGVAHQISNTGAEDFVFFVIADNLPVDSTYYPESDKWQIKPQRKLFRLTETDYFDGEE